MPLKTRHLRWGGHIASVNTSGEQSFVATEYGVYYSDIFLGNHDLAADGIDNAYKNADGTPQTYSNWLPGYPELRPTTGAIAILISRTYFNSWEGGWFTNGWYSGNPQETIDSTFIDPNSGEYAHGVIAEIPLTSSITLPTAPKEGAGFFTTSINLSAGTTTNLANSTTVHWKVTGITAADLASGALTGSGTISNGKLDIQHSLVQDADTGEKFEVSVFSDSGMTQQIGSMGSVGVQEATSAPSPAIRGDSLYTLKDGVTWHQGETYANSIGGHLASINDAKENTYLQTNFQRGWVGYTDELKEGEWLWTDGSTSTYTNWQAGQPDDARGIQDYAQVWDSSGKWDDAEDDTTESAIYFNKRAVIEVTLNLSVNLPTSPTEGAGEFTVDIDLTAGTVAGFKYSLVTGAEVWYVVSGVTQEDLEDGYSLTGTGTINASGNVVLNGATTAGIKFALKDDGIAETEDFKITFYTADPSTTTEVLDDVQLGALESIAVVDTGVPFEIGTLTKDDPTIYISGISGSTGTSKIESVSIVRTVTGTGKNRVTTETPSYTTLATYSNPGVDGITFNGGASANTIRAAGVSGDPSRPAFNGQAILDGKLGIDTITGGSYRNWLVGGGIFSTPLSTTTTAVDTLIGTAGALDVFDLRTSDFTADAYSALNTGSARINNYGIDQDWIVLAGTQGSYTFTAVQTTTGSKRNKVTTTTGYQIFSGTELMATVNAASGTTLTGNAANDLKILYGQTGDPTDTLIGGQQMFF
jgi:hypothetical protein